MTDTPSTVRIDINDNLTTQQLEQLIAKLVEARARMLPAVPMEPPAEQSEVTCVEQEDVQFRIRTRAHGGLRIWLRNEGVGWLAFSLAPADVEALRAFLGKQIGHTHTAH